MRGLPAGPRRPDAAVLRGYLDQPVRHARLAGPRPTRASPGRAGVGPLPASRSPKGRACQKPLFAEAATTTTPGLDASGLFPRAPQPPQGLKLLRSGASRVRSE